MIGLSLPHGVRSRDSDTPQSRRSSTNTTVELDRGVSSKTSTVESVTPSEASTVKDLSGNDTPRKGSSKRKRSRALFSSDEDTPPKFKGMRVGAIPSFLHKSSSF